MENSNATFQNLDFGTGSPSPVKMEIVEVKVEAERLMKDYVRAFINEARRKAPLTAALDDALTEDELFAYTKYLLTKRVETIELNCKDWRKLKVLWIPSFIQYILSMIGEVVNREYGLKFIPVMDDRSELTFEQASIISDKIFAYYGVLQMVRDAMPRGVDGDADVMACALIDGYVRSWTRVSHPSSTYVAAFVNAKLNNEMALKALYRIQYDDLEYIRAALISGGGDLC